MTLGALGFGTTPFGAKAGGVPAQYVQGWSPTLFGTPLAGYRQTGIASGWSPTRFGTPNLKPGYVPSLGVMVWFGTPDIHQYWRVASMGCPVRFGTVFHPFEQTAAASGWVPAQFGRVTARRVSPTGVAQLVQPFGWSPTRFGTTRAAWAQYAGVVGFAAPTWGAGTAAAGVRPAGWAAASFGTPAARHQVHPAGFAPVRFGQPTVARPVQAAGRVHVRWGTPTADIGGTHKVRGFSTVRFGRPRVLVGQVRQVAGFAPTMFGTPAATQTHRASGFCSVAFGTPLLVRNTTC